MLTAVGDGAKHRVLPVEPIRALSVVAVLGNEEELAAARVRGIGLRHGDGAHIVKATVVDFIRQGVLRLSAVTGRRLGLAVAVAMPRGRIAAGTVAVLEIAALDHEAVDDAVEDGPVVGPFVHVLEEGGGVGGRVGVNLNRHVAGAVGAVRIGPRQGHAHHFVAGQRRTAAGLAEGKEHGQEHHAHEPKGGEGRCSVLQERWNEVLTDALLVHLVEQVVVGGVVPLGAAVHLHRSAEVLGGLAVRRSQT